MTQAQLAKRLRISQPATIQLERSEGRGAITLATLERAARALDCQLVYALVPRKSLESMAAERAEEVARQRLQSTRTAWRSKLSRSRQTTRTIR
jgi:predicted DNA-binding mobile mystery protein A